MAKAVGKSEYFSNLYKELQDDDEKNFWDLVPVQNTLLGRIVSHVIFRSVGVDMPRYIHERMQGNDTIADSREIITGADTARIEFMSAWLTDESLYELQAESLTFHPILNSRSYQLWLASTLSKIPLSQWEKAKHRFSLGCCNALYIVVYALWMCALRGQSTQSVFSRVPSDLNCLERYLLSQNVHGYELDEECAALVDTLTANSKQHGRGVIQYANMRTVNMFKEYNRTRGFYDYQLTDDGEDYYAHSVVLYGLWCKSVMDSAENQDVTQVLSCAVNALIGHGNTHLNKFYMYYVTAWSAKYGTPKKSTNTDTTNEEIAQLNKVLKEREKCIIKLDAEVSVQKKRAAEAEKKAAALEKQLQAAQKQAELAEVQLVSSLKQEKESKKAAACKSDTAPQQDKTVKALATKVAKLSTSLESALLRIEDLYTLLSIDEKAEEQCDCVEHDAWKEQMESFKGKLILYGGTNAWQERLRKWFESYGVKVRTYAPGDAISNVHSTDTFILNVIENKHMYSVKCLNYARKVGAELRICNLNNLEQTLKIIFEPVQYRAG